MKVQSAVRKSIAVALAIGALVMPVACSGSSTDSQCQPVRHAGHKACRVLNHYGHVVFIPYVRIIPRIYKPVPIEEHPVVEVHPVVEP